MASTKLFPPILNSYINAFVYDTKLKISFKLSQFNTKLDFSCIHCTVTRLDTNLSALDRVSYPNGIKIINLRDITIEENNNGFYIFIEPKDIEGGAFTKGLYKIQLRLSEVEYNQSIREGEWLVSNKHYFSEWSTVAITKAIGKVNITEPTFFKKQFSSTDENILYLSSIEFNGVYDNTDDESEQLDNYKIQLLDMDGNIIEDSGNISAISNQGIHYSFKKEYSSSTKYIMKYVCTTRNYYELSDQRLFTLESITTEPIRVSIFCDDEDRDYDEEEGQISVHVYDDTNTMFSGNLNIRRSSSKTKFSEWEDMYNVSINSESINFVFEDNTAESGTYYLYCIREVKVNSIDGTVMKDYGTPIYMSTPVMREYNHGYLLGEDNKQLKLSLNYQISSFQRNVKNSVVETIGGKYPIITRNGEMSYISFPISGTISFLGDENNRFIDDIDLFGGEYNKDLYSSRSGFNSELTFKYDYIKERLFREKVIEFLQDGKPKLYKSSQEGNMIVTITDLTLTPNTSLGRLIYDFSLNIYEIDEITQENLLKYKFYKLNELNSDFIIRRIKIGQYMNKINLYSIEGSNLNSSSVDIVNSIKKTVDYGNKSILGYSYRTEKINNVNIEFNSKPMLVEDKYGEECLGYKININGTDIIVGEFGYYSLDDSINLNSLVFYGDKYHTVSDIDVTIDFNYVQRQELDKGKIIKSRTTKNNIGQYFGSVSVGESIYSILYYRYYFEWEDEYQKITKISRVTIQGNPNVVLLLKDYYDKTSNKHIIGDTGLLSLDDFDNNLFLLSSLSVYGTYYGKISEYSIEELNRRTNGKKKILYSDSGDFYVWDRDKYLLVEVENDDIYDKISNVDLIIDYRYTTERGSYYVSIKEE